MLDIRRFGNYYHLFVLTILFFCASANIAAQTVKVDARLDSSQILIGDQVYLHLDFYQPEEVWFHPPQLEKKLPKQIEVLESEQPDTFKIKKQDRYRISRKYLVTSFDTGKVQIPSLTFHYEQNNKLDSVRSFPVNLLVQTVTVDTTKSIFDIKQPYGAPITFLEILPYLGGLLGLAIIVLVIIYFLKKRRQRETEKEYQKPKEPAHVIAYRELEKLKKEKLWQNDKVKLYYTRLTDILRRYLWLRYDIKTLERTTDEILDSLNNRGFERYDELYKKLEDVLHRADLVKFAKGCPEPDENEKSLDIAYEFVDKTKQEEVEKTGAEENKESEGTQKKTEE